MKLTVTVGIPAFNEEKNIKYVLESILTQRKYSYILEKILVISDGSTDHTDKIVTNMKKSHREVQLLNDGKRVGKSKRLSYLYRANTSDILIQLDADVILTDSSVFEELLKPFHTKKDAIVVSGDRIPVAEHTFIANVILAWNKIWGKVRISPLNANTINNCFSCIIAFKKKFAQTLILNPHVTSEGPLIYCELMKRNLPFYFAPKATVYFKLPGSIRDYLIQTRRWDNEDNILEKQYGSKIKKYYVIPRNVKIKVLAFFLLKDPIYTIISCIFFLILPHLPYDSSHLKKSGFFTIANSTKTVINFKE